MMDETFYLIDHIRTQGPLTIKAISDILKCDEEKTISFLKRLSEKYNICFANDKVF